jgi:myo-inositol-1(or 4)-monophosphatase
LTDWLAVCRQAVGDVKDVVADMPQGAERERVVGAGLGGDDTTAIDAAAEAVFVKRLEHVHVEGADFTLVSEELGERRFGEADDCWVVLDPIDGSLNAKRGLPHFAVSVAVADGPTMADVFFGYVFDFGSGEEWTATRGGGAQLDGKPLADELPRERIEILAFEATRTDLIARHAPAVAGLAYRLRIMGSLALALCNLAAGRLDAVCSLKPARAVDIAAAQLLLLERGLAIELFDEPTSRGGDVRTRGSSARPSEMTGRHDQIRRHRSRSPLADAPLDVEGRSRIVAAANEEVCARLAAALSA